MSQQPTTEENDICGNDQDDMQVHCTDSVPLDDLRKADGDEGSPARSVRSPDRAPSTVVLPQPMKVAGRDLTPDKFDGDEGSPSTVVLPRKKARLRTFHLDKHELSQLTHSQISNALLVMIQNDCPTKALQLVVDTLIQEFDPRCLSDFKAVYGDPELAFSSLCTHNYDQLASSTGNWAQAYSVHVLAAVAMQGDWKGIRTLIKSHRQSRAGGKDVNERAE